MSVNPHRGEVEIELGDEIHVLKFRPNDLARLDQSLAAAGLPGIFKLLADGNLNVFALRQALYYGMLHEGHRKLTPERVGDLMEPERFWYYFEKIQEALEPWLPFAKQEPGKDPTSTGPS